MSDPRFGGDFDPNRNRGSNSATQGGKSAVQQGGQSSVQQGGQSPVQQGSKSAVQGGKSAMQQAGELASDFKDEAARAARDAADKVKRQASEVTDRAKDLVSDTGDRLKSAVEEQKNTGADFVSDFAGAVRRAATEFDQQIPQAGQYIRRAAEQIDSASDALRRRDLNQLLGDVQDFARRQPTAFLGVTVLAGFALVRFLKSSAPASSSGTQDRATQDRFA